MQDKISPCALCAEHKCGLHQVGHEDLFWRSSRWPKLFAWMGKQIAETRHLEIDIDCRGDCTAEEIKRHIRSSGHKLNPKMETLVLTRTCRCCSWYRRFDHQLDGNDCHKLTRTTTARLQKFVMSSCPGLHTMSLLLDKAPSWRVHGPSLQHMCLQIPPSITVEQPRPDEDCYAEHLYSFKRMHGMHHQNLPQLLTLFLQGLREPVELRGIDFQHSRTLKVINVHDCWIDDLALPPACKVFVAAQSDFLIDHMDRSPMNPLVSRAKHVCLPTDLGEYIYGGDFNFSEAQETQLRQIYPMGIPDMFPAMRSLRMTRPNKGVRCCYRRSWDNYLECFSNHATEESGYADMPLYHIRGLSRH